MTRSPEIKETYTYVYLGRLGDFGLGSEHGIRSDLDTDAKVHEYAQQLVQCVVAESADKTRVGCFDGRRGLGFADGSEYVPLDGAGGGTLSDTMMAFGGESDVLTHVESSEFLDASDEVEEAVGKIVGTACKCSHEGGCGACMRAIEHVESAASEPVQNAVETVMKHGIIKPVTKVEYDGQIANKTVIAFKKVASTLKQSKWDGAAYTERAIKNDPRGVEKLAGKSTELHHGHKEKLMALIADPTAVIDERLMDELGLGDAFKYTLGRQERVADALAGQRGMDGKVQATIAGFAWGFGVGDNLCHTNMPVIIVTKAA